MDGSEDTVLSDVSHTGKTCAVCSHSYVEAKKCQLERRIDYYFGQGVWCEDGRRVIRLNQ
jgi:hypothetical protein